MSTATATSTNLTEAQAKYAEMERNFATNVKPFLDELKAAKDAVVEECGVGAFFQGEDGTVYHVADKKGAWVDFTPFDIQRTRRPGESKGTLSLTAAREAGFEVVEG